MSTKRTMGIVPTPSKFTSARQERILVLLRAGASRRAAAELVRIAHTTLGRWIARGRDAPAGTMFARFHRAVQEAEAERGPQPLPPFLDEPGDVAEAWRYLVRTEFADPEPPAEPSVIEMSWHDGTPIDPAS